MKDLRSKLREMYWLVAKAERLELPYGSPSGNPERARARADKAYASIKEYYTSDFVLVADIDILLDVMETITYQGGEVKILRNLVLDAFRSFYEAALAYDKAIQERAHLGKSWVAGKDLDYLYDRWISLATSTLEALKEEP